MKRGVSELKLINSLIMTRSLIRSYKLRLSKPRSSFMSQELTSEVRLRLVLAKDGMQRA